MQRWDEVHEGTLAGYEVHPDDAAVLGNPDHYGIKNTVYLYFANNIC